MMEKPPAFMQGIKACNDAENEKCPVACDPAIEDCDDEEVKK
jgi:hypothetical protein